MRLTALVVAASIALVGATWADPATATPRTVAVDMANFAFSPAGVSVHVGDTVTWANHDTAPHDVTVTSGPVAAHSPMLATGQTWSYMFTTPGTYDYICSIHPDMHAVVIVAAPTTAQTQTQRPASVVTVPAVVPYAASETKVPATSRPAATTQSRAVPATTTSSAANASVGQAPSAAATVSHPLKPLLIVAGLVAAIATFCLLVLASRPDEEPTD